MDELHNPNVEKKWVIKYVVGFLIKVKIKLISNMVGDTYIGS